MVPQLGQMAMFGSVEVIRNRHRYTRWAYPASGHGNPVGDGTKPEKLPEQKWTGNYRVKAAKMGGQMSFGGCSTIQSLFLGWWMRVTVDLAVGAMGKFAPSKSRVWSWLTRRCWRREKCKSSRGGGGTGRRRWVRAARESSQTVRRMRPVLRWRVRFCRWSSIWRIWSACCGVVTLAWERRVTRRRSILPFACGVGATRWAMPSCAQAAAASREPSLKAERIPRTNSGGRRWMSCFFHPEKMPQKQCGYGKKTQKRERDASAPINSHSGFVPAPTPFPARVSALTILRRGRRRNVGGTRRQERPR